jgi:hypothetical protein
MWVGDFPSYSVPFNSLIRRKVHDWQNGILRLVYGFGALVSDPCFKNFGQRRVSPVLSLRIYPMQGIESLPYPCHSGFGRARGRIPCHPVPENHAGRRN